MYVIIDDNLVLRSKQIPMVIVLSDRDKKLIADHSYGPMAIDSIPIKVGDIVYNVDLNCKAIVVLEHHDIGAICCMNEHQERYCSFPMHDPANSSSEEYKKQVESFMEIKVVRCCLAT